MYSDFGGKIRKLAIMLGILGTLASVVGLVVLMKSNPIIGVVVVVCGSLVSWVVSIVLFGFGVLLDNMEELIENTGEIIENGRKQIESTEELIEQNRNLLENNRAQNRSVEQLLENNREQNRNVEELLENNREQNRTVEKLLVNNREQNRNMEELLEISKSIQADSEEEKQDIPVAMEALTASHSQTGEAGPRAATPHRSTTVPQILKNLKMPNRLMKYIENLQGNPSEHGE